MNPNLIETETRAGDYVIDRLLGKGQFSSVHVCFKRPSMNNASAPSSPKHAAASAALSDIAPQSPKDSHYTKHAIKIINKGDVYSIEAVEAVENELKALAILQTHPNIINVFDCIHGHKKLYILTEQLGSDLFDFIEAYQFRINFVVVGVIMRCLIRAVSHLVTHNVVHRDIKPENVLITVTRDNVIVKLADFGMCRFLSPHDNTLKDFGGSPGFFAPEVLLKHSFNAFAAEVWSLGVVALELLTSQSFFSHEWMSAYDVLNSPTPQDFSQKIRDSVDSTDREITKKYSNPSIRECVCSMLLIDAMARPSALVLLENAWIQSCNVGVAADGLNG
jgi:serine/threonine protein kinase